MVTILFLTLLLKTCLTTQFLSVLENKDTPSEKDHTLLIVLVVVGIIAILIIAAIVIKIGRKKHEKYQLRRRVSSMALGEGLADRHAKNDPERYEMEEALKSHDQKKENEYVVNVSAKENPGFDQQ